MAEKKCDPCEDLSNKIEQCLTVKDIHKKVTLASDYRKRFECKNCSTWFHENKKLFDKGKRIYTYLECTDCKWYTLLHKPSFRMRNVNIHRFFLKSKLIAKFFNLGLSVPTRLYATEPMNNSSSDDSGIE